MIASNFTHAELKINSFLTNGFLSGKELIQLMETDGLQFTIATSYDRKLREEVPLNCISKMEGIMPSLFHSAKGGLVVMVEERVGGEGILGRALQRNAEAIEREMQRFSMFPSFAKEAAINAVVLTDEQFISDLTDKVQNLALFVLEGLEVQGNENISKDGCQETGRKKILPGKISHIYIPLKHNGEFSHLDTDKIVFVDSLMEPVEFTFCYKDESDLPKQITIKKGIIIPNYIGILRQLSSERNLKNNPLYTHMTRLP